MHHALALAARATPQLRNGLSTQSCHEPSSIAPVVTCPTSMTCFVHLPVAELPASQTHGIKGEAFRAHSHLSERSESSKGVSRHIKGVTVWAAPCESLQPYIVQPRTLPARTINSRLGCTPGNNTLLTWDAAAAHTHTHTQYCHYTNGTAAHASLQHSSPCCGVLSQQQFLYFRWLLQ